MLSAVTMTACNAARAEDHQPLSNGRDYTSGPMIQVAYEPFTTDTSGELDSPEVNVTVEAAAPTAPTLIPYSPATRDPMEPLGKQELLSVLRDAGWPDYLLEAASSVAWCESNWTPGVLGSGQYLGLFQLWSGWFRYAGLDVNDWRDATINARAARAAYLYSGGWGQWECRP